MNVVQVCSRGGATCIISLNKKRDCLNIEGRGVTLAQQVKAPVGQADVQRFEPHLGYNWLGCGVFLVKSRHFGLPLAQTLKPNWQSLSQRVARSLYKRGIFTKSIPEETRTITVPSLNGL